jgi:hypothetical protein
MKKTPGTSKIAADKLVRGIKRKTRKHDSSEEKIRIVLAGLRGEESIAALCPCEVRQDRAEPMQSDPTSRKKSTDCVTASRRETGSRPQMGDPAMRPRSRPEGRVDQRVGQYRPTKVRIFCCCFSTSRLVRGVR